MAKFEYNPATEVNEQKPTKHNGHCEVYGCPWEGHIMINGWNCRYHHGKNGSSLARITLALRNHAADFRWYEFVMSRTPVDFLVGDVAKMAPEELQVLPSENFKAYKARMKNHVESLFEAKSRLLEVAP